MFKAVVGRASLARRTRLTPSKKYPDKREIEKVDNRNSLILKMLKVEKIKYPLPANREKWILPILTPHF